MKKSYILIFVAASCIMSLASCVSETMVYEDNDAEIGFAPVSGPATKIVSGAMDKEYSQYETFGISPGIKMLVPVWIGAVSQRLKVRCHFI